MEQRFKAGTCCENSTPLYPFSTFKYWNFSRFFLLVNIFGPCLENRSVIFHCDNFTIVHTVNKQSCRNITVMKLLRPMILLMLIQCCTYPWYVHLLPDQVQSCSLHIPGLKKITSVTLFLADRSHTRCCKSME